MCIRSKCDFHKSVALHSNHGFLSRSHNLNYAGEHMKGRRNPPVGLVLCAEKGTAEAHYSLDNLPNKILAAEYRMVLHEKVIADQLRQMGRHLEERRLKSLRDAKED